MRLALLRVLPLLAAAPAQAWGPVGHRVTGAIADRNLSGVARAQVRLLLGTEDLAEASTWPDDMRSDPAEYWRRTASPWHYVTVREGDRYAASDAPKEGRSEEHTSELQSLMRSSYAVFCLKQKNTDKITSNNTNQP